MDLKVILTSTVVAAIISTFASIYNLRRTGNLKYITEERQKWREEIRKISEDISLCSQFNIKTQLARLKVRINAEGFEVITDEREGNNKEKNKRYLQDGHIWRVIDDLENAECINQFEDSKKKLILYLSALLKYDWERTKQEVKGSSLEKSQIIFSIFLANIFLWLSYDFGVGIGKEEFGVVTLLLLPCILMPIYKQIPEILKKYNNVCIELSVIVGIVSALNFYTGAGNTIAEKLKKMQVDNFIVIGVFCIMVCTIIFTFLTLWKLGTTDYEYICLIEKIENNSKINGRKHKSLIK